MAGSTPWAGLYSFAWARDHTSPLIPTDESVIVLEHGRAAARARFRLLQEKQLVFACDHPDAVGLTIQIVVISVDPSTGALTGREIFAEGISYGAVETQVRAEKPEHFRCQGLHGPYRAGRMNLVERCCATVLRFSRARLWFVTSPHLFRVSLRSASVAPCFPAIASFVLVVLSPHHGISCRRAMHKRAPTWLFTNTETWPLWPRAACSSLGLRD